MNHIKSKCRVVRLKALCKFSFASYHILFAALQAEWKLY